MNRLALVSEDTISAPSAIETSHPHDLLTTTRGRLARGFDVPYATFAPIHYEEGYAYPLVVWLHDSVT
jgi:hypothetical protein